MKHAYKINPTKYTSYDPYFQPLYYFYKKIWPAFKTYLPYL